MSTRARALVELIVDTCFLWQLIYQSRSPATSTCPAHGSKPTARFSTGYSYDQPYGSFWVSATGIALPSDDGPLRLRYRHPGFHHGPGRYGSEYGRYKDKVVDAKLRC
jgi:hypothetical protein